MKRFFADIVAPLRAGGTGRAERAAHWMLAAAIVFPLAVFAVGSVISYRQHEEDARDRLRRNLGTVYEHALKVLETIELSSRYVDELLDNVTDDDIRATEAGFNRRLRALTDTLPQLADIWVVDANGRPLVSGTVFPIPRQLDLSDRRLFPRAQGQRGAGPCVGEVVTARATNERGQPRFFSLSRKRISPDGRFAGVIGHFDFARLFPRLLRHADAAGRRGADPRATGWCWRAIRSCRRSTARLTPGGPLGQQLASGQEFGTVTTVSAFDGKERIFAFRKLPRIDVYVTAGVDTADITEAWTRRHGAPSHLRRAGDRRDDRALPAGAARARGARPRPTRCCAPRSRGARRRRKRCARRRRWRRSGG